LVIDFYQIHPASSKMTYQKGSSDCSNHHFKAAAEALGYKILWTNEVCSWNLSRQSCFCQV